MNRKCAICKHDDTEAYLRGEREQAYWAWQPFGPDKSVALFSLPGNHYRGFPVVKVCADCKARIERGEPVEFKYDRTLYTCKDRRPCQAAPCCERCGEGLRASEIVWLELNMLTGIYAEKVLTAVESQGCFPFGRTCAKRVLANGGRLEHVGASAMNLSARAAIHKGRPQ